MKTKLLGLLMIVFVISACNQGKQEAANEPYGNPAAEGFNTTGSDARAIAIADEVMEAMGGRQAWDETRHICWKFFGRDELVWDKWTGNVRIDRPDGTTLLYNINDNTGHAFVDGAEVTGSDSLLGFNDQARRIWINHSYWLVMPFKLKDSGVTLKYVGEEATQDGKNADKLMLTFEAVGVTPENKYYVWVDTETKLVSQWAYYPTADADSARFINPWTDYNRHGKVLLSTSRGRGNMEDIMVFDELPESVYNKVEKPDLKAFIKQ